MLHTWDGTILREFSKGNLVVTDGKGLIANLLRGQGSAISHIAVGDDNTTPALDDVQLLSETYRDQITSYATDGAGKLVVRLFIGTGANNGNTIRESGIFNSAAGGEMLARVVFDANQEISKTSSISVQVAWTINFD